ncbi:MAG: hypothetical protein IKK24_00945 [Clostridia bacterium]|nr:hypothetical protein [Clostridia bacterium]
MENEKIICNDCGTENENKYIYCKNCGTKLPVAEPEPILDPFTGYPSQSASTTDAEVKEEPAAEEIKEDHFENGNTKTAPEGNAAPPYNQGTYTNPPVYNYNQQYNYTANSQNIRGNFSVESIEGIPYGEVAVFVGKKADKYMPVFSKMEITASKTGWHWPVAILGFLLGPLGAALWFFYRKMYKYALILAAIGAVLTVATSILAGPALLEFNPAEIYNNLSGEDSDQSLLPATDSIEFKISDIITDVSSTVTAVICGLFTYGWYKKHIIKSIMKYRYTGVDPRYYPMGLASLGGTSGGMLALGIIIMILTENIASIGSYLINTIL